MYLKGNVVLKKISRGKGEDLLEQTVDIRLPPTIEWGHQKTTCTGKRQKKCWFTRNKPAQKNRKLNQKTGKEHKMI